MMVSVTVNSRINQKRREPHRPKFDSPLIHQPDPKKNPPHTHDTAIYCFLQAESASFSDRQWFEQETGSLTASALLPSPFVPYSSYSLRFILTVLRNYFLHRAYRRSVNMPVSPFPPSIAGRPCFFAHKALWLGVLEGLETSAGTFLDGMDGVLSQGFFLKFRFSFLQRLRGRSGDPPFGMPGQVSGST